MSVYVIGDIQGCYDELNKLLDQIQFNQNCDRLWFTGDLVNRGPMSLETLRLVYSLRNDVTAVLGNHDLHLLATAFHHQRPGKKDTFDDILSAPDADDLLDWLRHLPLLHNDRELNMVMVHAGIHPGWHLETAQDLATEVELVLQGAEHVEFYKHMYGDKPVKWSKKLKGWARLRFITNIFTRLRYCDRNGRPSLGLKGPPGTQPADIYPWFEIENRATRNENIVFGHWSTLMLAQGMQYNNVYPVDTGCLWGGKLTALKIDTSPFEYHFIDCPEAMHPQTGPARN